MSVSQRKKTLPTTRLSTWYRSTMPAVYGPEDTFTSSVVEGFQLKLADVFG
jgi:hypothetical protein